MWKHITSENDLIQVINEDSKLKPIVLFKHSTRCPVSFTAKKMFESSWDSSVNAETYLVDLIAYRSISSKIEELLDVQHESPQLLLVSNENCVYNASHGSIDSSRVIELIQDI